MTPPAILPASGPKMPGPRAGGPLFGILTGVPGGRLALEGTGVLPLARRVGDVYPREGAARRGRLAASPRRPGPAAYTGRPAGAKVA